MTNNDLEATRKRLAELETWLDQLTNRTFAYLTAILEILEGRGLTQPQEVIASVERYKKRMEKATEEKMEFLRLMGRMTEEDEDPGLEASG